MIFPFILEGKINIELAGGRSSQYRGVNPVPEMPDMGCELPFTWLADRLIISAMGVTIEVVFYEEDGIRGLIFSDGPYSSAVVKPDNGIFVEYGRDAHQGYEPDIVMFVQVQPDDVIVGKPVFFGEIMECPAVEPAYSLVGGKPDEPVVVLQTLVDGGAGQPIPYSELFIGQLLAAAMEAI
jgi:hypothetical protein